MRSDLKSNIFTLRRNEEKCVKKFRIYLNLLSARWMMILGILDQPIQK